MFNYIRGEFYRITHKKSSYIYFSILFALFVVLMLLIKAIADIGIEEIAFVMKVIISGFSFYCIGIPIYMAVYADDLSAKTLSSAVSAGVGKLKLVIAKVIIEAIYLCTVYLFAFFVFILVYLIISEFNLPTTETLQTVGTAAGLSAMSILAFSAVSSIFAYLAQRTALAIIIYILTGSGLVQLLLTLLSLVHDTFKTISEWTLSGRLGIAQLEDAISQEFLLVFLIYLIVSIGTGFWILREKEIRIN